MTSPAIPSITASENEHFAADGFLVLPDLVPMATIEAMRVDADALLRDRLSRMETTRQPDPRVTWWRLGSGRSFVLKIKPVVDLTPCAAALANGDEIRARVADLLGTPPWLMESKLMYKQIVDFDAGWANLPVLGEDVCKHTDAAYFAARGHRQVLTVAVCLDRCTAESGALRVWRGSHLRAVTMTATEHQGPVVPDTEAPDTAAMTLVAGPGTVLMWDSALVHASGPNTSGRPRRLLVLGYAPADAGRGAP